MNTMDIVIFSMCVASMIISIFNIGKARTMKRILNILDPVNLLPIIDRLADNECEKRKMMMLVCRILDEMGGK